ncbi:hypothetical protein [Phocaeicola sartorii]|uniref:hypothetical protein n=1 Tax=Phocaeicola sartorii TaxID=671267 RepID=UPI00272CDE64|nr:hypothetical protein [Phocaeicola sartorii]
MKISPRFSYISCLYRLIHIRLFLPYLKNAVSVYIEVKISMNKVLDTGGRE